MTMKHTTSHMELQTLVQATIRMRSM